jgi:hypothetical protein
MAAPKYTVESLVKALEALGGSHVPWYEVEGAQQGSVLRAAMQQKLVVLTPQGGLALVNNRQARSQSPAPQAQEDSEE